MEITIIGIISIVLSIYAFIKNENMLLELAMFFSVFTAAIAIGINVTTTPIWPFEIPVIFWILKQFINIISGKMNIDIKKKSTDKKLLITLGVFVLIMIVGELWLFINNMNISYYDYKLYKDMNITFSLRNITQPVRLMLFIIFAILLVIKKLTKVQIVKIIRAFEYGCIFSLFWGFVQYIINTLNIEYPSFIFNNNQYASQGYDQRIGNLTRITSIASEPPVFGFTLLTFLPLSMSRYLKAKQENDKHKIIYLIVTALTIICGLLSTSSTFYFGFFVIVLIFIIYKLFDKNNTIKDKLKYIFKVILSIILLGFISLGLLFLPKLNISKRYEQTYLIENNTQNTENKQTYSIKNNTQNTENKQTYLMENNTGQENKKKLKDATNTLYELTINKLQSGSGKIRLSQEKVAIKNFLKSPILGLGYGTISTYTLFINILVNFGIIGEIIYIYMMFICIITIKRNRNINKLLADGIIFSVISMSICFFSSISDITYLFFWGILILGYKYFSIDKEKVEEKNIKKIGIDARGLDGNRTGISTYIEKIIKQINNFENDKNEYILYSNRKINLDIKLKDNIVIKECNKPIGTFWLYFILPKLLKEDNIDVFWGTQHCLPQRNTYTKDIKYVLTVHDLAIHKLKDVGELKNTVIQKIFLEKSCRNADSIMADSEATKKDIEEIFKINKNKINVVYLGTNFTNQYTLSQDEEQEILKKFNVEDRNYLFFVSTIEPRKNIITLVKAFEKLKEQGNIKLKLILAGGLGWKYENILETINNSKYKEDITLPGYISKQEKECLLHNTQCFVYPSLYEGFGLPILEAMANEAIVVTSHISSIPEVGKDVAIYFYDVLNYNELAETINKALNMESEEKVEKIKEGKKLTKQFTWEKCAKEIKKIL